jgi:hypothetical protein
LHVRALTRSSGRRAAVAALLVALAAAGCEPAERPKSDRLYEVPEMRFAGVDLNYALRRIAAEADVLLILDEIRPKDVRFQDLGFERVDVDLEAGPIDEALEKLREQVSGAFDFRLKEGLLLVRSSRSLEEQTVLDEPLLPGAVISVDLERLLRFVMEKVPNAYLTYGDRAGQPVYQVVELNVSAGSSILDLFEQYGRSVPTNLHILRAGYDYEDPRILPTGGKQVKVVANTLGLWSTMDRPQLLPRDRQQPSVVWALASVQERTGVPIGVLDRAPLLNNNGFLSYRRRKDRGLPLEEALDIMGVEGGAAPRSYNWSRRDDGVIRVASQRYDFYLPGKDLMDEKVAGGTFEGSLAELTRWLNAKRKNPSEKVLMGGEIVPDATVAKIEVPEDTRVEDVLFLFAAASNEGFVVNIKDALSPREPLENTWAGAYVTRLHDWGENGEPIIF